MERQAGAEGMEDIGEDYMKGMGGPQSGGNVIQGDETGGASICMVYLVTIGGNAKNSVRDTHWVSETNHRKVGVAEGVWYVVHTSSRGSARTSGNTVGNSIHLEEDKGWWHSGWHCNQYSMYAQGIWTMRG